MALFSGRPYLDPLEPEGDPGRNLSMQTALDDFMNNLSASDVTTLERVALTVVEVTSATPPHAWAGHRHTEVHYSASLLKVAAMYTAHDLLAAAKQQIIDQSPQSAADFFASLNTDFTPAIQAATPANITNDPRITNTQIIPSYQQIIDPQLDASGIPVGADFTANYAQLMSDMIVVSSDAAALQCIHALGYGLINARLADDGFFDSSSQRGIWLAGDYSNGTQWPAVRVPAVNDGTSAQATTAVEMARLYTLMSDEILVTVDNSDAMLALLAQAGAWFDSTTPPIWPSSTGIDATRTKVGVGPLAPNAAGVIEQVVSEGLTAHDPANDRDFVVVWQNLKGATSFANMSPVARMIEAAINGFNP